MDQSTTELPHEDAFAYLKRELPRPGSRSYRLPLIIITGVTLIGIVLILLPSQRSYTLRDLDRMREAEKVLRFATFDGVPRLLTPQQAVEIEEAVRTAMTAHIDPASLVARAAERRKALLAGATKERDDLAQALVNARTRAFSERQ